MKIKEAKLSTFTDDMKIHVENVIKESRKELSELINKFSKVSGLKLNINYIFYTLVTKKPKKKSKKAIAFTVASKRKKNKLRHKFNRRIACHTQNYKILLNKIKKKPL